MLYAKMWKQSPLPLSSTEQASIRTPVLILGGTDDPISTPELMTRTARCLPHCKLVMYSNCGHNIDTDLTEELAEETDRFLRQAAENGKWYFFPR